MTNICASFVANTYSYTITHTATECLNFLAEKGFSEFELMMYPGHIWPAEINATERKKFVNFLTANNFKVSTINMPNVDVNIAAATKEMRTHSIDHMRRVIELAGDRQAYIDQAQSLNLFFRPDAHIKYIHAIHFMAWKKGLKTLYYCRSEKIGKADKVSKKIERNVIKELDMTQIAQGNDCIACEG